MKIITKDNRQVHLEKLNFNDLNNLVEYLNNLSNETKKRFGPHQFDMLSIVDFYNYSDKNIGYVAKAIETNKIVAYSIIKVGYLDGDFNRFQEYGINLDPKKDCAFAPSVADLWQSCGIGNYLFQFILSDIKNLEINRIVLWGGVQADNERAINYYRKNGFKQFGQFVYNGENLDMMLQI